MIHAIHAMLARGRASDITVLIAVWLALHAGCHTEFRFDDHSIDANRGEANDVGDAVEAPPEAVPSCQSARCGYKETSCTNASCELECPYFGNCTGLCGANCSGDCEEDSHCTLTTGAYARLRCEARARCLYTFGDGSESRCEVGSHCDIVCLGTCSLICDKGATCAFTCSPNAQLQSFTARASCP